MPKIPQLHTICRVEVDTILLALIFSCYDSFEILADFLLHLYADHLMTLLLTECLHAVHSMLIHEVEMGRMSEGAARVKMPQ